MSMSTDMSTSHNQGHLPTGVRVHGYAVGAVHDLARPASIDTSSSGDPLQSSAEVSVNGYEIQAVGSPDQEAQREFNELLARFQCVRSPLAKGAPNAAILEELPSPLSVYSRQRSPGPPHGAQDMAAAARLLQLSAVEVPNRAAYALEHQTSREQAEEHVGQDPQHSTEFW